MPQLLVYVPNFKNGGGEVLAASLINYAISVGNISDVSIISEGPFGGVAGRAVKIRNWKISFLFDFLFKSRRRSTSLLLFSGPIFLFGLSMLRRNAYLYEHGDPFVISKLNSSFIRRFLYRRAISRAEKIFVVNDFVQNKLIYILDVAPSKVVVIDNPVKPILHHPSFRFGTLAKFSTSEAIIIGRDSPEKRIAFGVDFLKRSGRFQKIIVVSDTSAVFPGAVVYANYDQLPPVDLRNTILFNFSYSETFSLVIGEWLASGGTVYSVECPVLVSLWSKVAGFNIFNEEAPEALDISFNSRCDFQGISVESYCEKLLLEMELL